MEEILKFAGDHPFLVVFILIILTGFLVKVIPWAKRDD